MPTNPKYFEQMSVLLDEIIQSRKQAAANYEQYLKEIINIANKVKKPEESETYPLTINSKGKQALFDNVGQDESLAIALHEEIMRVRPDGWRGNKIKERQVKNSIKKHIVDEIKVEEIFNIIKEQKGEY